MLSRDLIGPILSFLDPKSTDGAGVLRACCLVAWTFCHEAQPRLFSHVEMWSTSSEPDPAHPVIRFRKLLDNSPHIAPWVRMAISSKTEDETKVFELLVSLRILSFSQLGESWPTMPQSTQNTLQKILPRLYHLSVDFLVPGLLPWNKLPSLRLSTGRVGRWIWTEPLPGSRKLKLDRLELAGNAYYQFDPGFEDRFFLWNFLDLTSINSIVFNTFNTRPYKELTRACYRSLLLGARMNLTSLTWGSRVFIHYNWNEFKGTYDLLQLDFLPALENLTIEFLQYLQDHREICLEWLCTYHFNALTRHPLRRLSLRFKEGGDENVWKPDWQHEAWTALDTVIQQETFFQFQCLDFGLMIPLISDLRKSLEIALPESSSKGLVELWELGKR